jgi:phospholipid-translocating ATPase
MGIIVRHRVSNKLIFYVKGADTVMVEMVKPAQRSSCKEHCEYLAMEGLRTLVITQRLLREQEYEDFEKQLIEAKADITDDKDLIIQKVIESLEHEMEFLCVTGVEDKL